MKIFTGKNGEIKWSRNFAFINTKVDNPKWLSTVKDAQLSGFMLMNYNLKEKFEVKGKNIRLGMTTIEIGCEGKLFIEQGSHTFQFMEKCFRRTYSNFRLAPTFRVFEM